MPSGGSRNAGRAVYAAVSQGSSLPNQLGSSDSLRLGQHGPLFGPEQGRDVAKAIGPEDDPTFAVAVLDATHSRNGQKLRDEPSG